MIELISMEVVTIEKRIGLTVRISESVARQFKSKCALEGITGQDVLERAIMDFLNEEKRNPE